MSFLWSAPKKRRTRKSKGRTAYRKGKIGETKALKFLSRRGIHKITDPRFRVRGAEIDAVVRDGRGKAFLEVKNLSKPVSGSMVEKFGRKIKANQNIASRGIFVSKSGYAPNAKKAARGHHIRLIVYKPPRKRKKSSIWGF